VGLRELMGLVDSAGEGQSGGNHNNLQLSGVRVDQLAQERADAERPAEVPLQGL
jgi:hypothetical protein